MISRFKVTHHAGVNQLNVKTASPQTRNACWLTQIVMGRENKLMYSEHTVPNLEYFHKAEENHDDENSILFPQCKPLTLSFPAKK